MAETSCATDYFLLCDHLKKSVPSLLHIAKSLCTSQHGFSRKYLQNTNLGPVYRTRIEFQCMVLCATVVFVHISSVCHVRCVLLLYS